MRNLSVRPHRRNREYRHKPVSLEFLWSQVCSAYQAQGNWRAGEDKAFSKALAAYEAALPENQGKGVVVRFQKGRGRG